MAEIAGDLRWRRGVKTRVKRSVKMELFLLSEDGDRAVAFDPSGPWHGWTFLRDLQGAWVSEQRLQREPLPWRTVGPGVVLGGELQDRDAVRRPSCAEPRPAPGRASW